VPSPEILIAEFERFVRRDPGGRGLIGPDADCGVGAGELLAAARELSQHGSRVALVTGFFIPVAPQPGIDPNSDAHPGFAETDGPPGTALLARVLQDLGITVQIITDVNCAAVVRRAAILKGLAPDQVVTALLESAAFRSSFWQSDIGRSLSHLVAIERVGPSYTRESLVASGATTAAIDAFETLVPNHERGHCFNMRGMAINHFTGDLHRLFDELPLRAPEACVLGVGDGGNEIGMGRFEWDVIRQRLGGPVGAKIPCRIAARHTIVAGTSNWGAYALAAAVALLRNRIDVLEPHTAQAQHDLLSAIVADSRAVDGVTRRHEATVDGLPFLTYIQPWLGIRRLLGLGD